MSVVPFPFLLCAALKVLRGLASTRPAGPRVTLNSHEVVDLFQTKGSSYPTGTDGSPTLNVFERTKEVSNRNEKKKSTAKWILPPPPPTLSILTHRSQRGGGGRVQQVCLPSLVSFYGEQTTSCASTRAVIHSMFFLTFNVRLYDYNQ